MDAPFGKLVGRALLNLYALDKYLYNVAARLKIVEGDSLPEPNDKVRGYTDGVRIYLTEAWCEAEEATQITTLTHETLHVISKHLIRMRALTEPINFTRMNVAADLSICGIQVDMGQEPPIADCVANWEDYRDMDMFRIYELLTPEEADNDLGHPDIEPDDTGEGEGSGNPSEGSDSDNSPANSPTTSGSLRPATEEEEGNIDSIIQQAAMQAEAGNYSTMLSKSAARQVDLMRVTTIRWDRYLQQIVSRMSSDLPTWSRPNRRMMSQVYLPSYAKKETFEATLAIDVSGSVGEKALNQMCSVVQDMLTKYVTELHLMTFDDKLVDEWFLKRRDKIIDLEINGYGGTYVQKVITHLEETKRNPKLLVIATDGWIPKTAEPPYKVIWLIFDNPGFTTEYGTVIHINSSEVT